jgi:hypothetical protein
MQKRKAEIKRELQDLNSQPDDPQDIAKEGNAIISRWRGTTVDLDKNTVARYVMQLEDEVRKLKGQLSVHPKSWSLTSDDQGYAIRLDCAKGARLDCSKGL